MFFVESISNPLLEMPVFNAVLDLDFCMVLELITEILFIVGILC